MKTSEQLNQRSVIISRLRCGVDAHLLCERRQRARRLDGLNAAAGNVEVYDVGTGVSFRGLDSAAQAALKSGGGQVDVADVVARTRVGAVVVDVDDQRNDARKTAFGADSFDHCRRRFA